MKTNEQVVTNYINSYAGWHYICNVANRLEVWKTPTRWLVCSHYDGVFKFVDHQHDVNKAIQEVSRLLKLCS